MALSHLLDHFGLDPTRLLVACLVAIWLVRVAIVLHRGRSPFPAGQVPLRMMAVLGSGGHTAEMLPLLQSLDPAVYTPREYVLAASDSTSAVRIETLEAKRLPAGAAPTSRLLRLPRAREVGVPCPVDVAKGKGGPFGEVGAVDAVEDLFQGEAFL